MMGASFKLYLIVGVGIALWFLYGWGMSIINNYTEMAKTIERLERDKALIESRVDSLRELKQRRDDAIAASRCRVQIETWIKNPESIPGRSSPFSGNSGG